MTSRAVGSFLGAVATDIMLTGERAAEIHSAASARAKALRRFGRPGTRPAAERPKGKTYLLRAPRLGEKSMPDRHDPSSPAVEERLMVLV